MIPVPDGRPCGCGPLGCEEQDASSRALVTEARQRAARSPEQARLLLELGDGRPESVTGPMATMAAVAGDPVALASFAAVGTWLGQGMADLAAILDPRCSLSAAGVRRPASSWSARPGRPFRPS
jgi:glucokinase